MRDAAQIEESAEHGVVWKCRDSELADQFDDFLTEQCFVLFTIKFDGDEVSFFFGQASSVDRVRSLFEEFCGQASSR